MDMINSVERIRRFNSLKYIKFKLASVYSIIFISFLCIGALMYNCVGENTPCIIGNHMMSFWNGIPEHSKNIDFITTIIYNSVDIFKISFIIIIAGFTYISRAITKITTAIWGFYNGFAVCYCAGVFLDNDAEFSVLLMILSTALYGIVFVSNCMHAELTAQEFSKYHNISLLLTSECFWKYIAWFLVSFGYVLMICTSYNLIIQLM